MVTVGHFALDNWFNNCAVIIKSIAIRKWEGWMRGSIITLLVRANVIGDCSL